MKSMVLTVLLALSAQPAPASEQWRFVALDLGRSTSEAVRGHSEFDIYRVALQRDFRRHLLQGERVRLSGYFEASLNVWDAEETVYALAFSPVLALFWDRGPDRLQPYFEIGIGAALISDTAFAGRRFSTAFQFEDRVGIGLRSRAFDLHYRFMHYSNGGIEKPNNGFDAHVVGLAWRF